jgi:hypothetical protein
MYRFVATTLGISLLVLVTGPAFGHQAKGGTPPATGGQPPATGGQPPATGGQPPATGGQPPAQIQPPPNIQGKGAQSQGTNNQGTTAQAQVGVGAQGGFYQGTMGQTPWFNEPQAQQQLKLSDAQANQLRKAYAGYWSQYQQGLAANNGQQPAKMGDLTNGFNNQLLQAAQGTLSPAQFQRFQQLHMQAQGFNYINNPQVQQQLNLTAAQRQKLSTFDEQHAQQFNDLNKMASTNAQEATKQYQTLRTQYNDMLNSTLTDQQRQVLRDLIGEPYNFSPYWDRK